MGRGGRRGWVGGEGDVKDEEEGTRGFVQIEIVEGMVRKEENEEE